MRHLVSLIAALALLITTVGTAVAQFEPATPQDGCEYFDATQHNLCDPFESYWNTNGGLEVFGYPISEAFQEVNPDLDAERLSQYFERERLEFHPENEGTEYEILLGRLGAQILELNGITWQDFPKADPNEPFYVEATGQAIAPEFQEYWSSHGLDLGDDGTSYRESVALFGYPISPLQTETNMAGDTVPTQWFERARFELHEDGVVLLGLLGSELVSMAGPAPEPPPFVGEVVVDGLNNPRGITIADDGTIYVAQAGVGGGECFMGTDPSGEEAEICYGLSGVITSAAGGSQTTVAGEIPSVMVGTEVTGAHDVVLANDGTIYSILGLGGTDESRLDFGDTGAALGHLIAVSDGAWETLADIAAYESEANPDGGFIDSNPYSLVMADDGGFIVSDAGMNALVKVDAEGNVSTLAALEVQMVDAPPFLGLPEGTQIPMESVPTGLAVGPDGAYYVGELTGFPFAPGSARVWRVTDDGAADVYAEGFTNIIDVAFDSAGNLYVLEMLDGSLLAVNPEDPTTLAAQLNVVAPDGTITELPSAGLIFATGLAVGPDDAIYVSNFGVMPGMGQIIKIMPE